MYSSNRRGPGTGAVLLAVMQTLLLLSALVLVPASVIAQDTEPSHEPAVESTGGEAPAEEAAAESEPEPKADPKPKATAKEEPKPPFKKIETKPEPKPAAKPTLSERGLAVFTYPRKLQLKPGERTWVTAWICPDNRHPFGGVKKNDRIPGTKDDSCFKAKGVDWELKSKAGARLSTSQGHGAYITLLGTKPNRITVSKGDVDSNTKITPQLPKPKPAPAKPAQPDTTAPAPLVVNEPPAAPAEPFIDIALPADPIEEPADPIEEPADPIEEPAADPSAEPAADPFVEFPTLLVEEPSGEPVGPFIELPTAEEALADAPVVERDASAQAVEGENGTITIKKQTDPDSTAGDFDFRLRDCGGSSGSTCSGSDGSYATVTLQDDGVEVWDITSLSNDRKFEITETSLPGSLELTDISCTDDGYENFVEDLGAGSVEFYSSDPDNSWVTCTFTNSVPQPGSIAVTVYGLGTSTVTGAPVEAHDAGTNNGAEGSCTTGGSGSCIITGLDPADYDIRVVNNVGSLSPMASVWLGTSGGTPSTGTTPYQQDRTGGSAPDPVTVTSGNQSDARLVMKRSNVGFPQQCGLDIALVIDRSGSTSSYDAAYKQAAKDFVDALAGTPSRVGIWAFAAGIGGSYGQQIALTDVDDTVALYAAINGLPATTGSTNWDQGISQVSGVGADIVIVITDGNPTTNSGSWGATDSGGTVNVYDVEGGVTSANLIKSTGQHIMAVGIGSLGADPLPTNLINISGTTSDDYFTGDPEDLGAILREIALRTCGGTIIVEKEVPKDGGGWQKANGWDFTATINPPINNGTVNGSSGTDGETTANVNGFDGIAKFEIAGGLSSTWPRDVDVVEDAGQHPGYSLDSVSCEGANSTSDINRGVSVTMDQFDIVTCTFRNIPDTATLTIKKFVLNDNGGDAVVGDFGIQTTPSTALSPWTDSAGAPDTTVYTSQTVTVTPGVFSLSENNVAGYSEGRWECKVDDGSFADAGAYNAGSVDIAASTDVLCRILNDDDAPSLILKKTVVNDNGGTAVASDWTLYADALSVTGSAAGSEVTDQVGTYALTESAGPADYTNTSITCDDDPGVEVTDVTVALGETITCEFVNDDDQATIVLRKIVAGGLATQDDFDPYIDQEMVAWDDVIDINPGDYTASEVMNVTDYVATDWTGDCASDGSVSVELGDALECTITNQFVEVEKTEVPSEEPSKKPTDLLLATDAGPMDSDNGSGGFTSWAVWVLLSGLLIVGSGWVIRRQRLAEADNR